MAYLKSLPFHESKISFTKKIARVSLQLVNYREKNKLLANDGIRGSLRGIRRSHTRGLHAKNSAKNGMLAYLRNLHTHTSLGKVLGKMHLLETNGGHGESLFRLRGSQRKSTLMKINPKKSSHILAYLSKSYSRSLPHTSPCKTLGKGTSWWPQYAHESLEGVEAHL